MRSLVILTLMFALVGCQPTVSPSTENRWTRTELYFGQAIPAGGEISEEQWQKFVDEVVTPRFPEGLSVSDLRGQWRESSGRIVLAFPTNGGHSKPFSSRPPRTLRG